MSDASVLFARYMLDGNYAAAERICRIRLRSDPADALSLACLALVARNIGRLDYERLFLSKMASPFGDQYRPMTPIDQIVPPVDASLARRYLIVTPRGCGLWSDFASVVGAYILAWCTNRVPIVSWRHGCQYNDDGTHDAFTDFFEPLSDASIEDLTDPTLRFDPPDWTYDTLFQVLPWRMEQNRILQHLSSQADVTICRDYVSPFLALDWAISSTAPAASEKKLLLANIYERVARPVTAIRDEIASFVSNAPGSGSLAALHLRGTDKFKEDPDSFETSLGSLAEAEQSPFNRIFVMSDDGSWIERARQRLGDRMITRPSQRSSGSVGLHYAQLDGTRRALGVDIVVETMVAVEADSFYGSGRSNVSATIALLRSARQKSSCLSGDNNLLNDNDWGLTPW